MTGSVRAILGGLIRHILQVDFVRELVVKSRTSRLPGHAMLSTSRLPVFLDPMRKAARSITAQIEIGWVPPTAHVIVQRFNEAHRRLELLNQTCPNAQAGGAIER